jgi:hypothetical protein
MISAPNSLDSLKSKSILKINNQEYRFFSIKKAAQALSFDIELMPY